MYINKTLENYIRLYREDKEHINNTNSTILEAMVGLYYARMASEGDERVLGYLQSAEAVVTELHFLIENMKDKQEEEK